MKFSNESKVILNDNGLSSYGKSSEALAGIVGQIIDDHRGRNECIREVKFEVCKGDTVVKEFIAPFFVHHLEQV